MEWLAFASNAFNTMVPFYANVDMTPEYLSNTTGDVSTDNFYWASRLLAAMADASYAKSVFHIERYTLSVGSKANGIINTYDDAQRGRPTPPPVPPCAPRPTRNWPLWSGRDDGRPE